MSHAAPAIQAREVTRVFRQRAGRFSAPRLIQAVRGVNLTLRAGQTLGLVGESGCGKSTLGRLLVGLDRPTSGEIRVQGTRVDRLSRSELRAFRRTAQYVFQNPYASLDPRMTIGAQLAEPLTVHSLVPRRERDAAVRRLLDRVGMNAQAARRYPHEFSGGQRQRLAIARALALSPHVLVADEPVSALDVSVQAQILNLLADLQADLGLTMLFISHDLAVVEHVAPQVAVMYLGEIVERGPRETLFQTPLHPYTRALLASAPRTDPTRRVSAPPLAGEPPSPLTPPSGCPFHPRCPQAEAVCAHRPPPLRELEPGQAVACWMAEP